eukprot:37446-Pleurochrysis_carterae.AAC.1
MASIWAALAARALSAHASQPVGSLSAVVLDRSAENCSVDHLQHRSDEPVACQPLASFRAFLCARLLKMRVLSAALVAFFASTAASIVTVRQGPSAGFTLCTCCHALCRSELKRVDEEMAFAKGAQTQLRGLDTQTQLMLDAQAPRRLDAQVGAASGRHCACAQLAAQASDVQLRCETSAAATGWSAAVNAARQRQLESASVQLRSLTTRLRGAWQTALEP